MGQGLPPGAEPEPNSRQQLMAGVTVLAFVVVIIVVVLLATYAGGWVAHVLADTARSGWDSK